MIFKGKGNTLCSFFRELHNNWIDFKNRDKQYKYLKRILFYCLAIFTLFLPDLLLRNFVQPKVYVAENIEFFADILPFIFSGLWIAIFFSFANFILPKRAGRIFYIVVGALFFIFAFAQYVYSGIFDGQFFRLASLGLAGEGADYLSYALSYIDSVLIKYTVIEIICLIVVGILWERPVFKKTYMKIITKSLIVFPIIGLVVIHVKLLPEANDHKFWDSWKRPGVIYEDFNDANKCLDITGVYHFALRDSYKAIVGNDNLTEEDYAAVDKFMEEKKAAYVPNEYTNMFEGKNVIAVMLEGIDDWMISEKYTPVMKYMMNNGINFSNYYAPQFGTGLTLGAEFCFHTGYYTPISGINPVNYTSNYFPYAIPRLFAKKGYSVNSFHYNNAEFYNRGIMHTAMGYRKYHSFMTDYGIPEQEAWSDSNILKRNDIFEDMVKDEPFFSFVITYSGHVPYDWDDAKLKRVKQNHPDLIDPEMDTETNNCHLLARDTDDFFRMLLEKLDKSGKLDDTVILVFTDHDAYGFSDQNKLLQYSIEAGCSNVHRVPAFIYHHGTEPLEVTKPCQTADWAPTVVNLFGLENHHCYLGDDILSSKNEGFVHFADYAWISGDVIFNPGDAGDSAEIKEGQSRAQELIDINDIVISGDYFDKRR